MKYLVSVSSRVYTDIIIDRPEPTGKGWHPRMKGWPELTDEEVKEASKALGSSDAEVPIAASYWSVADKRQELEIESIEEAGPEFY